MIIAIQPNLAERTVFEAIRKDSTIRPHYEREFEACYADREPATRDQAFAILHERWFGELGFHKAFVDLIREFPNVEKKVSRMMIAQAPNPKAQTMELFGEPGQYAVIVGVAPAVLLDREVFNYWARHELIHIDDMLNPLFEYNAAQRPSGSNPAARSLAQDRYAVLWALSVDARLDHRGLLPDGVRENRKNEFHRAFGLNDLESNPYVFERLWSASRWFPLSHKTMFEWAQTGLPCQKSSVANAISNKPVGGAPCSLCGFPSFEWTDINTASTRMKELIIDDFPTWVAVGPICSRCADIYHACECAQVKQTALATIK